jgi:hypothetical protein
MARECVDESCEELDLPSPMTIPYGSDFIAGPRISNSLKRDVSFVWIFSSRKKSHLLRGPGCLGPNEGIVATKSTEAITVALKPPEPSAEKTREALTGSIGNHNGPSGSSVRGVFDGQPRP